MKYTVSMFSLFILLQTAVFADPPSWETLDWNLEFQEENLSIHTARVNGSAFKAVKSRSTYKAPISGLIAMITDMSRFGQWVAGIKHASLIKKVSSTSQLCYNVNAAPFPLKDRDVVILQSLERVGENEVRIITISQNGIIPEKEQYTRMKNLTGMWILRSTSSEETELTYIVHVDPAGNVPSWVVNQMIIDLPRETMLGLHKALQTRTTEESMN